MEMVYAALFFLVRYLNSYRINSPGYISLKTHLSNFSLRWVAFLSYYLLLQIIKLTSHLSSGIWVRLYGYLFPWGNPEGNGTE